MGERLTKRGRKLLQQQEAELARELSGATMAYGRAAGFGDGDGYHDETANLLEGEVRKTSSFINTIRELLHSSGELKPPKQFTRVELGHRVRVELPDDEDAGGTVYTTILSSGDTKVLSGEFDQKSEILVSDKSPLGSALLGKRVGDEARYGSNRAIIRSIKKAKIFQDK